MAELVVVYRSSAHVMNAELIVAFGAAGVRESSVIRSGRDVLLIDEVINFASSQLN